MNVNLIKKAIATGKNVLLGVKGIGYLEEGKVELNEMDGFVTLVPARHPGSSYDVLIEDIVLIGTMK